ncbi:RNA-binding S4 domain-containing protein [Luteimonas vadosa]
MDDAPITTTAVRLDLWLWAARFFKTRRVAKEAVEGGKVTVAGLPAKPSRGVLLGDAITVMRGEDVFEIVVLGLATKRGPATVARTLYSESEASRLARESRRAEATAARAGYRPPDGRPDKRARRLIRALGDIDAS